MGRVAIVGGGPGGVAVALALHRQGHEVVVHEQRPEASVAGSGLSLSSPPMKVLRNLGVDVEGLGAPAQVGFARWDGRPRAQFPALPQLEQDFGASFFGLLRPDLHERMVAALPPGVLRVGEAVAAVEGGDGPGPATLQFDDGSTSEADLVVGADGIGSVVRRQLWGDGPVTYHGFHCWQGWCELDGPDRSVGRICHDRDSQASWTPILRAGRPAWQWWVLEPWPQGQAFDGDPVAYLTQKLVRWTAPLPDLVAATDPATILRREIVDRPRLKRWSRGRVTLLGDAAHPTSPYAAYGAGMAIEDGYYLARHLFGRDLGDVDSLGAGLRAYEDQREARTARTATFARTLGRVYHRGGPAWQRTRDLLLDHTPIPRFFIVQGYVQTLRQELRQVEAT